MALAHITEPLGAALVHLDQAAASRSGKTIIQTLADVGGWQAPEHNSERYRMLEAALASRGMPWRFGGGEGAHDAWSLARECAAFAAQRDCIDVERPGAGWGITEQEARKALTQWGLSEVRLRHAAPGDLLLFDMPEQAIGGGRVYAGGFHVAVMSAPGGDLSWSMLPGRVLPQPKIIHAYPVRAVVESWMGPMWSERLVAAFSFDTPGKPLKGKADWLAIASDVTRRAA